MSFLTDGLEEFFEGKKFSEWNRIEWKYEKLEIIPLINLLDDFY